MSSNEREVMPMGGKRKKKPDVTIKLLTVILERLTALITLIVLLIEKLNK